MLDVVFSTYQSGTMDAERGPEVRGLVEAMFEAVAQRVAVCPDEVGLHFRFADHAISVNSRRRLPVGNSTVLAIN